MSNGMLKDLKLIIISVKKNIASLLSGNFAYKELQV